MTYPFMSSFNVRPAARADLPQVQAIFEYYVLFTVSTFCVKPPSVRHFEQKFEEAHKKGLPWLVCVDETGDKVVGYSYASSFRATLGYGHSLEITLFCHHEHTSQGIGSVLLQRLLEALHTTRHLTFEAGYEDEPEAFEVKKIIAIMAVDTKAADGGLRLRDWYVDKFAFEQVAYLKGVGVKQDRR
jgi:L-amino acid N-acyltransferase YncA